MSVSKEAIEAASATYWQNHWKIFSENAKRPIRETMEKALEAALPFLPIAGEGKPEEPNRARVAHAICVALDFPAPQKVKNLLAVREVLDRYYATSSPGKDGGKRIYEFDRYIKGQLMAEGVTIERASTLEEAFAAAARIASRGHNGEVPVLVMRPMATTPTLATEGFTLQRIGRQEVEAVARAIDADWWKWADVHYNDEIPGDRRQKQLSLDRAKAAIGYLLVERR